MIRRLFRDSAIYAGSGIFTAAVAFILFPFLAHKLHPRAYGTIDIVGLLTTIAMLTVALEINEGLARASFSADAQSERSAYASTALIWSVASYTVFAVVCLVFAKPLTDVLLGKGVDVWITRVAIARVWVAGALYVVQDQLRWQLRPRAFAAVAVVTAVATTVATAVYVFPLNGGALGVVAAQVTGALVGLMTALALSPGVYRLRFDRAKAKTMLAYAIPLVPSSVGVFLNGYADRLAIQHERSLSLVGVYAVGFRIATVMSLLLVGMQGATIPHVVAQRDQPGTRRELATAFRLFWALGCVAFVVLSVMAEPLVRVLSAPSYYGAAEVVPLLVAAVFLAGLYAFAPGPAITGRTRLFAAINVAAGFMNLGLAFALVPGLGIRGAGIATAASSLFLFVGVMALSQRLYAIPHDWPRLALGAGTATLFVVVTRSLLVSARADALDPIVLLARLGICAIAALVLGALLVNADELRTLGSSLRHRQA